jgi:FkbM family methyltransferase
MTAPFVNPTGTDYREKVRTPRLKSALRGVLLMPVINRAVLKVLEPWKGATWRSRVPVFGPATLRMEHGATIVLQKAERCQIAKEIYWGGGRLENEADRLALDLALRLSRDADRFLDVGAYTGLFALAVARLNPRVHSDAYEIVPENYLLMWENTIHNNLVQRVHPKLLGLGADRSTLKVPSSLGSGVLASSVALDSVAADGTDIPIAPLDDVYVGFDGRMVMKIDVEGFEWEVFRGGRELVARVKPDIVCEVLRRAPNVPEMREFLVATGYHIFHITAKGLRPATQIVPVKHERDWLFTTRSAEALQALGFTVFPSVL